MKDFFFLYSQPPLHNIIKEIFTDFETHNTSLETIKKNNFRNKNILLIINETLFNELDESLFKDNNVIIFFTKESSTKNYNYTNAKIFYGQINIKKFIDEVSTSFASRPIIFGGTKIWGEAIINTKTRDSVLLTPLEKEILKVLFKKTQIEKHYLLESVLKIRKDTETKTIESHLTRIRKKLYRINSQIEILSKDNKVFLVV